MIFTPPEPMPKIIFLKLNEALEDWDSACCFLLSHIVFFLRASASARRFSCWLYKKAFSFYQNAFLTNKSAGRLFSRPRPALFRLAEFGEQNGIFHLQNQLLSLSKMAHSASFGFLRLVDLKGRFCQPPFYDF